VTDIREDSIKPFDEVKEDIRSMLYGQEQSAKFESLVDTLRADADIEILDKEISNYRENDQTTVDDIVPIIDEEPAE
jgi:parvulin-like peptidyl-prolyl isomerase